MSDKLDLGDLFGLFSGGSADKWAKVIIILPELIELGKKITEFYDANEESITELRELVAEIYTEWQTGTEIPD